MHRIYGIIYGDRQTEYTPYVNRFTTNRHRFENDPIIDITTNLIADMEDHHMLGIFSWRFTQKTRIRPAALHRFLTDLPADVQVVNCSPYLGPHIHFMEWSDEGHRGIIRMITRCLENVGLSYYHYCQPVIYAQQFLARKDIYYHYVNTLLLPSLALLEGKMWKQVNRPAGYTRGMELAELKRHTGLDFYNYVPFICERLFMQYVANYNYKTVDFQ